MTPAPNAQVDQREREAISRIIGDGMVQFAKRQTPSYSNPVQAAASFADGMVDDILALRTAPADPAPHAGGEGLEVAGSRWIVDPNKWGQTSQALTPLDPAAARIAELEARVEIGRKALGAFLDWGQQQCPCYNDLPNPCPLCGASIENLEGCKAIESKFPPRILGQAREALAAMKGGDL